MNARNLRILLAEGGHGEAAESLRALFTEDQKRLELTIVPTISTLLCAIGAANPEMILLDLARADAASASGEAIFRVAP